MNTKPVFLSSQINDECFTILTTSIREGCNSFYLDSGGGSYGIASAISHAIGKVPNSQLFAVGECFSVALPTFLFTEAFEKEVCSSAIGMFHLSSLTMSCASNGRVVSTYDKFLAEEVKYMDNADKWFLNTLFTEKEKEIILEGKDYYFSHKRLREMMIEAQDLTWEDWENAECR